MELEGTWIKGKYGCQLQVDRWHEIMPPTIEGIRGYLSSGLLKGIGEKTADAIIQRFGVQSLYVLEHQPDKIAFNSCSTCCRFRRRSSWGIFSFSNESAALTNASASR